LGLAPPEANKAAAGLVPEAMEQLANKTPDPSATEESWTRMVMEMSISGI